MQIKNAAYRSSPLNVSTSRVPLKRSSKPGYQTEMNSIETRSAICRVYRWFEAAIRLLWMVFDKPAATWRGLRRAKFRFGMRRYSLLPMVLQGIGLTPSELNVIRKRFTASQDGPCASAEETCYVDEGPNKWSELSASQRDMLRQIGLGTEFVVREIVRSFAYSCFAENGRLRGVSFRFGVLPVALSPSKSSKTTNSCFEVGAHSKSRSRCDV
jgi:hypothetical protein